MEGITVGQTVSSTGTNMANITIHNQPNYNKTTQLGVQHVNDTNDESISWAGVLFYIVLIYLAVVGTHHLFTKSKNNSGN